MPGWEILPFTVGNPPRSAGTDTPVGYVAKAMNATWSWGARPASARVTYIESGAQVPISVDSALTIPIPGTTNTFYGVCMSDVQQDTASGRVRELVFHDSREFLGWDQVFGAFNQSIVRLESGTLKRTFWSMLPGNYLSGDRTFHDSPYTAEAILDYLLGAFTVFSPWTRSAGVDAADMLTSPVFDLDFMQGPTLASAILAVAEQLGLVMTLDGGRWNLRFELKGAGTTPTDTRDLVFAGSDDRRIGYAMSGNPTTVRVLGGRNVYQVMNVPLTPDWPAAWEAYWDLWRVVSEVYHTGATQATVGGIPAGTAYDAIEDDVENISGWFLAASRARTMTVAEFIDLKNGVSAGSGDALVDRRLFGGQSRMNMPVGTYINQVLFRAFRPPSNFSFVNTYGRTVTLAGAELVGRLLTRVTHNPVSGVMSADFAGSVQGNGYAVAQGYNVGHEILRMVTSDRFDASKWSGAQSLWQATSFQIDNSGEDGGFVVFDEPMILSSGLVSEVDGHAVINADAVLAPPPVVATLVFACERYMYTQGDAYRTAVESAPGLYAETVTDYVAGGYAEVAFADGQLADAKASAIATTRLRGGFIYAEGGCTYYPEEGVDPPGTKVGPVVDRVSWDYSDRGKMESIQFTKEAGPVAKFAEPERRFDRRIQLERLFPGQIELQREAENLRALVAGLRRNPQFYKSLTEAFHGQIGSTEPQASVAVEDGAGTLAVGTPLWAKDDATRPVMPAATGDDHKRFTGAVQRDAEPATRMVEVQASGRMLIRVRGPVAVGDSVGRSEGEAYLVGGGTPQVGEAQEEVEDGITALIQVQRGGGGGDGGEFPYDGEWNISSSYKSLRVVVVGLGPEAGSYLSRKAVPSGTSITNGEYWVLLGRRHDQTAWM